MSHVIAAISTAPVPSGIGILRLSGDGAIDVAQKVFSKSLSGIPDRTLVLGRLYDRQGRVIDQVLCTVSHGPNSYTGEDTAELQCHGSPAVLAAGLEALYAAGARPAQRGEFTKRAFLNGRMDLTQAEAVADLIDAETADEAANAAGQLAGVLSQRIDAVYQTLTDLLAHFHVVLDYPDEDLEPFTLDEIDYALEESKTALQNLLTGFDRGRLLRSGVRAALLGRPNTGKSSLLNALAGYDRVIVTATAGTTRDTVEETVLVGGVKLRLLDTAGIRATEDEIEAMGVERAQKAAETADLAIFVCDGSEPLTQEDRRAISAAGTAARRLAVINKSDLPTVVSAGDLPEFPQVFSVSAKTGAGLPQLESQIAQWFGTTQSCDGSLLTNARQAEAVNRALDHLRMAEMALQDAMTADGVLYDVEAAMQALAELTGRAMREDITNRIFERFCVGK